MKKTYGNTSTHLTLSKFADMAFSNTDPLEIIEHEIETDDGEIIYRYSMSGAITEDNLTAERVNEILEDWQKDNIYLVKGDKKECCGDLDEALELLRDDEDYQGYELTNGFFEKLNRLKAIRLERRLTQVELAEKVEMPQQTISKFEAGERKLSGASGAVLQRLSKALNCRIEDLLEDEEYLKGIKKEPEE